MYMISAKLIWQKIEKQNILILLYKQRKIFITVSVFHLKNETSLSIYLRVISAHWCRNTEIQTQH